MAKIKEKSNLNKNKLPSKITADLNSFPEVSPVIYRSLVKDNKEIKVEDIGLSTRKPSNCRTKDEAFLNSQTDDEENESTRFNKALKNGDMIGDLIDNVNT